MAAMSPTKNIFHAGFSGGTINGSTAGVASFQEGAVVIIDNSQKRYTHYHQ